MVRQDIVDEWGWPEVEYDTQQKRVTLEDIHTTSSRAGGGFVFVRAYIPGGVELASSVGLRRQIRRIDQHRGMCARKGSVGTQSVSVCGPCDKSVIAWVCRTHPSGGTEVGR